MLRFTSQTLFTSNFSSSANWTVTTTGPPSFPETLVLFIPSSLIQNSLPTPSPERDTSHAMFGLMFIFTDSPAATVLVTLLEGNSGSGGGTGAGFEHETTVTSPARMANADFKKLIFMICFTFYYSVLHSLFTLEPFSLLIAHPFHDIIEMSYCSYRLSEILHIYVRIQIEIGSTRIEI